MAAFSPEARAWHFEHSTRILFGAGRLSELAEVVKTPTVLLVTTAGSTRRGVTARVQEILAGREVIVVDNVEANPTIDFIEQQTAALVSRSIGTIIGLGGGSAVDTAKVLSVTLPGSAAGFSLRAHFAGKQALPSGRPLPVVAIPTTSGTGSEVTPFATVWDLTLGAKHSLATAEMLPQVALLDPVLTLDLPREITVATGLDAISQALESIWNNRSNPLTTSFALRALDLALPALPALLDEPRNLALRTRMLEASLLAGMAISHTRTALAHSMSYPLTARYFLPHGLACSFTLPAVLDFNAVADDGRLAAAAKSLGFGSIEGLRKELVDLLQAIGMDDLLRQHGITSERIEAVVPEMITLGRAGNNLRSVDFDDVKAIMRATASYLPSLQSGVAV